MTDKRTEAIQDSIQTLDASSRSFADPYCGRTGSLHAMTEVIAHRKGRWR